MKIGTKSVLFGAHQFLLHPLFVALAWWRLYGFPWDPRLWVAFFVHDIGYWGMPNMDGPEGEEHPYSGAFFMHVMFGGKWHDFTLFHSRFIAKRLGQPFSRLCVADKLACAFEPDWLYLGRVIATGEIREYMRLAAHKEGGKFAGMCEIGDGVWAWRRSIKEYLKRWAYEHADGREDRWTPEPISQPSPR